MSHAILTQGLVKRFGATRALDGLDLLVTTGGILSRQTALKVVRKNGEVTSEFGPVAGSSLMPAAGYALNRGILVGSKIETAKLSDDYPVPFYKKHCRYLFFTGVQQVWTSSESTREEAEQSSCAPLKSEPIIHRHRKLSDSWRRWRLADIGRSTAIVNRSSP